MPVLALKLIYKLLFYVAFVCGFFVNKAHLLFDFYKAFISGILCLALMFGLIVWHLDIDQPFRFFTLNDRESTIVGCIALGVFLLMTMSWARLIWEACAYGKEAQANVSEIVVKTFKNRGNKHTAHWMRYAYSVQMTRYDQMGWALTESDAPDKTNIVKTFTVLYHPKYNKIHCVKGSITESIYKKYKSLV